MRPTFESTLDILVKILKILPYIAAFIAGKLISNVSQNDPRAWYILIPVLLLGIHGLAFQVLFENLGKPKNPKLKIPKEINIDHDGSKRTTIWKPKSYL